jgi:hypothetical protein
MLKNNKSHLELSKKFCNNIPNNNINNFNNNTNNENDDDDDNNNNNFNIYSASFKY